MKKLTHNILPLFLLASVLLINACKKTESSKAIVQQIALPEYIIPSSVDNQMYTYVAPVKQSDFEQSFKDAGIPFDPAKIINSGFGDLFVKTSMPDGSDANFDDFDFGDIYFRKDGATSASEDIKVGHFDYTHPGSSECLMKGIDVGNLREFITSKDKFYMVISLHRTTSDGKDKKMAARATIKLDVSLD
jgi:hypothetical protein